VPGFTPVRKVITHWRGQAGQTTTEWLMVAGVLTMVAVLFLQLFPATLKWVLQAIGVFLRSAAP